MGWRGTDDLDMIVVELARQGPATIKQLWTELLDERAWRGAYEKRTGWMPPALDYQPVYMRLLKLERAGRVIRRGQAQWGAILWGVPTRQEVEQMRREYRAKLDPPAGFLEGLRARLPPDCELELVTDESRKGKPYAWLVLTTQRGEITGCGPPQGSWDQAAAEIGLG